MHFPFHIAQAARSARPRRQVAAITTYLTRLELRSPLYLSFISKSKKDFEYACSLISCFLNEYFTCLHKLVI